jgi:hypothetical protein
MTGAIHRIVAGRGRRLAASLIVVFAAISTVAVPTTAANAAILKMTIVAHVCEDIGHDSTGVHGILCSDLAYLPINGGIRYYHVTEAYCQNSSGYVQCLDNNVWFNIGHVGGNNNVQYHQSCSNETTRAELGGTTSTTITSTCRQPGHP